MSSYVKYSAKYNANVHQPNYCLSLSSDFLQKLGNGHEAVKLWAVEAHSAKNVSDNFYYKHKQMHNLLHGEGTPNEKKQMDMHRTIARGENTYNHLFPGQNRQEMLAATSLVGNQSNFNNVVVPRNLEIHKGLKLIAKHSIAARAKVTGEDEDDIIYDVITDRRCKINRYILIVETRRGGHHAIALGAVEDPNPKIDLLTFYYDPNEHAVYEFDDPDEFLAKIEVVTRRHYKILFMYEFEG